MKKILSSFSKISPIGFLSIFMFVSSVLIFAHIADENILEKNYNFDSIVLAFVKANTSIVLTKVMSFITFFGSSKFLFPTYILLVAFLILKNKKIIALDISIISISSTIATFFLKDYFKRNRPVSPLSEHLLSYSFPSGHSVSSFIFCSILAGLIWKTKMSRLKKYLITALLFLTTMAIGFSRIILMVHFATDVIAGFCFAIAWLLFSFWTLKIIRHLFCRYSTSTKKNL